MDCSAIFYLKYIIGFIITISGFFNAAKYSIQAFKISKSKTAGAQSRKFVLIALWHDTNMVIYAILIGDLYIFFASLTAISCMLHLWYVVYKYYPYRMRGMWNFKKPGLIKFTFNAMIPNRIRERL